MKVHRLIILMRRITVQLVDKTYISDFEKHDKESIESTLGNVRFIWQIRSAGTWLYRFNEENWEQRLLERINYYRDADISNIYYIYDKTKLRPIFENEVREIARKRIEARTPKSIQV